MYNYRLIIIALGNWRVKRVVQCGELMCAYGPACILLYQCFNICMYAGVLANGLQVFLYGGQVQVWWRENAATQAVLLLLQKVKKY